MYHILLKRATIVQKGTPKDVSHHYFIKLIIEKVLREQLGISWDDFFENNLVQNPIRKPIEKVEEEREPQENPINPTLGSFSTKPKR